MKFAKCLICCSVAFSLLPLSACDVEHMSSLKDISKPYVGEYQCRTLSLGGEDQLKNYSSVKLSFLSGDKFSLSAVDNFGRESTYHGSYEFADHGVYLTVETGENRERYHFPYEKGAVEMNLLFHEKLLYARFTMVD